MPMTALGEGQMMACSVAGEELLIVHVEGQFYAVSNRCSHAGQRLSGGRLIGFELSCPQHRATFDVRTGVPLSAPATERLKSYPVTLAGGKVNVSMGHRVNVSI